MRGALLNDEIRKEDKEDGGHTKYKNEINQS